ncbi:hypothetical protein SHIRM173S_07498 [Streptomyces hirsutus]
MRRPGLVLRMAKPRAASKGLTSRIAAETVERSTPYNSARASMWQVPEPQVDQGGRRAGR